MDRQINEYYNGKYNRYIGARYVPKFDDPIEWDNKKSYEPLTIVLYKGNSFTSKTFVPIGADINDEIYWAETGNYNAQIESYRKETLAIKEKLDKVEQSINIVSVKDFGAKGDGLTTDVEAFKKCFAYAIANEKIVLIPSGTYLINGIGEITGSVKIIGDNATLKISGASGDRFKYSEYFSISGVNFECKDRNSNIIVFKSTSNISKFVEIKNCKFTSSEIDTERNGVAIRILSESCYIDGVSVNGMESGIVISNTIGLSSKYYEVKNIFGKNVGTLIDVEGYAESETYSGYLRNVFIENVVLENNQTVYNSIENSVGMDCILLGFVRGFKINNVRATYCRERALYINTCKDGNISNIKSYNTGCVKLAGQHKGEHLERVTCEDIYGYEPINDAFLDIYDANDIVFNNYYAYQRKDGNMIRVRNEVKNAYIKNGVIDGSFRGGITFEKTFDGDIIDGVHFIGLDFSNGNQGRDGAVVRHSGGSDNWLNNISFEGISVDKNNKFSDPVGYGGFMHFNFIVNNISFIDCIFCKMQSTPLAFNHPNGNSKIENVRFYGTYRCGWSNFGPFKYIINSKGYYLSGHKYVSECVLMEAGESGRGNSFISKMLYTSDGNIEQLFDNITTTVVISGAKNAVYENKKGTLTKISGDALNVAGSGQITLPAGSYMITQYA